MSGVCEGTPAFRDAATLHDYLEILNTVFRPVGEVTIAKQKFRERKQGQKESLQAFGAAKQALYEEAFPAEWARGDHTELIDQFILTVANLEVYTYLSLNAPYPNITECVNTGLKCVATERTAVRSGRKKDLGGLSTAVFAIDDDRIGMDVTNSAANPKSDIPVPMEMGNMGAGHLGQVGPVEYYNEDDSYNWAEEVENDYPSWDDAGAEAMSMLEGNSWEDVFTMLSEHLGHLSATGFKGTCWSCNKYGHSARYCPETVSPAGSSLSLAIWAT